MRQTTKRSSEMIYIGMNYSRNESWDILIFLTIFEISESKHGERNSAPCKIRKIDYH